MAYWSGTVTFHANIGICPGHQLYFTSLGAQEAYFMQYRVGGDVQMSQLWMNEPIRVNVAIDQLAVADYVSWVNTDFSSKRYYARITSKRWVNANCAELVLEFDPWQTYHFDLTIPPCFVEREMQQNDWNGGVPSFNNIIDEGLELGEYVATNVGITTTLGEPMWLLFTVADPDGTITGGSLIDNVYTGVRMQQFTDASALTSYLEQYDDTSYNHITAIIQVPRAFQTSGAQEISHTPQWSWYNGYQPRNAKCFTAPFNIMRMIDPASGNFVNWFYEFMPNPQSVTLTYQCSKGIEPALAVRPPAFYKGKSAANLFADEALIMTEWPQCTWAGDTFANYLAQSKGTRTAARLGSAIAVTAGVLTGNPIAVVGGVASAVASFAKTSDKSVDNAAVYGRGGNAGSAFTFNPSYALTGGQYQIAGDVIERIDNFFDVYGYKTLKAKTPNLNTRPFWNYVKCSDATVTGPCTKSEKDELAAMFNTGVTMWHVENGIRVGDYTQNNRG